jgi:hypothetical protein
VFEIPKTLQKIRLISITSLVEAPGIAMLFFASIRFTHLFWIEFSMFIFLFTFILRLLHIKIFNYAHLYAITINIINPVKRG